MPSSVIASMSYVPETRVLRIVYVSDTVYDYLKVPPAVYEAMEAAFSKGTFLNKYIKGRYKFKKVR